MVVRDDREHRFVADGLLHRFRDVAAGFERHSFKLQLVGAVVENHEDQLAGHFRARLAFLAEASGLGDGRRDADTFTDVVALSEGGDAITLLPVEPLDFGEGGRLLRLHHGVDESRFEAELAGSVVPGFVSVEIDGGADLEAEVFGEIRRNEDDVLDGGSGAHEGATVVHVFHIAGDFGQFLHFGLLVPASAG